MSRGKVQSEAIRQGDIDVGVKVFANFNQD
jgi:hypothetical protein